MYKKKKILNLSKEWTWKSKVYIDFDNKENVWKTMVIKYTIQTTGILTCNISQNMFPQST